MNTAVAKITDERESFGPAMLACRADEREYVLLILQGKPGAEAARDAGWGTADSSANTMARIAFRLSHRERIIAAIGEEVKKLTRSRATLKAAQAVDQILDNQFHRDRARVALAVLERSDPTVTRHEVDISVKVDHHADTLNELRSLLALQVPREKLEELFGYSGLPLLMKQLAAQDAKQPIDVEYSDVEADPDRDILGD